MQISDRIGRRMKLHDLHVLMAVVQAGSMRKAAALLHTTQSAVSRSIADLEQTLGAKLLDRNAQGIEATRYGHALLRRSAAAFDELKQGVREIEFLSNPEAGELLIGSGSAFAEGFVLAVIERLSQQYPGVAYHLMPYALTALYGQLRERRIELAFSGNSELEPQDDIDAEVLFEEPLVVAASAENPWVRRRRVHLCDLINESWTWSPPGTVVTIARARRECDAGAGPDRLASRIGDEDEFTLDDVNKLILFGVGVPGRRLAAGLDPHEIDAVVLEPTVIAETPVPSFALSVTKWCRIPG